AVAQVALRDDLAVGDVRPDYLWAAVAYVAFALDGPRAVIWAAILGLVVDCLSAGPLGPGMLVAAVTTWFVQRSRAARPSEDASSAWFGRILFVVVTMLSCSWIRWEASGAAGGPVTVSLVRAAGDALCTVLLGLAVSLLASPLRRRRSSGTTATETPQTLTNQWKMLTP
ncbi:MAG TPA: rod shape-determining protein MreD, partial [Planctomycetaceae bacterium]|nr:rod shape-determining protein MreD [Planctomycetaceae bacterium]